MPNQPRIRLGFPVKVLGAAGLRSHDSRRWQNRPHLSVSLAYLRDIFLYLERREIRFYRMAGQLAPYLTHPELPAFHSQLDECSTELAVIGDMARQQRMRLTLHPGFFVQLSHPDPTLVARSSQELVAATSLLDGMGLDVSSVVVIHVGGGHADVPAALDRFARRGQSVAGNRAPAPGPGKRRSAVQSAGCPVGAAANRDAGCAGYAPPPL